MTRWNTLNPSDLFCMSTRREEIDKEIAHLRKLASQVLDQRALESIQNQIVDLETERIALSEER